MSAGISSLGIRLPSLSLDVEDLARLRGVDPAKYTLGLGCRDIALCGPGEGAVELAVEASRRALERWSGTADDLGLIAVGTESALDMSRPLSAWVAGELGLAGGIRSYEVKHACYGGTLALRQALEWQLSGAARGRAALVVAVDVALYAPEDPGEPTQGAGAVAMIVDGEGRIARVDPASYAFSEPAFDFWRPVGEAFPRVDGKFSLDCYRRAAENCFRQWIDDRDDGPASLEELAAVAFHVPFPKMVRKAVVHVGESLGWSAEQTEAFWAEKVDPTMEWNRRCGNAYTASLWIAVARALAGRGVGERLGAFSYGSGYGAELLTLAAGPGAADADWASDVEGDLARRERLDGEGYLALRRRVA